ncbi:hypothetical protein DOTSEDRAFT_32497 [Dothistroma septosporum NZE10]|uniref:Uncharacterized protein n=1 Tax=Dothistroma septosporum (strain NZE10 / CBS 128990) TaxID=675120 RepID=N1Q158_DOTSN|nr:hypothetical protein DOTSEDRAFT_32497 [Dothistroma septosporum NZE10]
MAYEGNGGVAQALLSAALTNAPLTEALCTLPDTDEVSVSRENKGDGAQMQEKTDMCYPFKLCEAFAEFILATDLNALAHAIPIEARAFRLLYRWRSDYRASLYRVCAMVGTLEALLMIRALA